MKIVHVITRLLKAGSEENTLLSCAHQIAEGHEVIVVHGSDYDPAYYASMPAIQFIEIAKLVHQLSPHYDFQAVIELKEFFIKIRPDVVHTHQSKAGIVGRIAAKLAKVPLIVHGVHIVPFASVGFIQKVLYVSAEYIVGRFTDVFIDVSAGVKREYLKYRIGEPSRHFVIHSGFDLAKFKSALPLDWREILPANQSTRPPIILMLAAFEPRKRHAEFLRHFPILLRKHPNALLVLAGSGPCQRAVEEMVRQAGIADSVRFLGHRSDPERLISLADVCVLVSNREGLPRVIMQYLAGGKPCVATFLPGIDEVLNNGINSVVVPSDSIEKAVISVSQLLDDKVALHKLSEGARNTDLSSWDSSQMCSEILQVYKIFWGSADGERKK